MKTATGVICPRYGAERVTSTGSKKQTKKKQWKKIKKNARERFSSCSEFVDRSQSVLDRWCRRWSPTHTREDRQEFRNNSPVDRVKGVFLQQRFLLHDREPIGNTGETVLHLGDDHSLPRAIYSKRQLRRNQNGTRRPKWNYGCFSFSLLASIA